MLGKSIMKSINNTKRFHHKSLIALTVILFWVFEVLLMKELVTFPQVIDLGFIGIRTYGIFIMLGVILVSLLIRKESKNIKELKRFDIIDGLIIVLIGGILGARLYHLITDWYLYASNPISALYLWNGGLGIFGAIAGGLLALLLYSRKRDFRFLVIVDLVAIFMPLAQIIGRFGNLVNLEIVGLPTKLPWAWNIASLNGSFHPVFLYEQIGNTLLFILLFSVYKKRVKRFEILGSGNFILIYLFGYSLIRFFVELWRTEPKYIFNIFSVNQIVCLFVIIISAGLIFYRIKLKGVQK